MFVFAKLIKKNSKPSILFLSFPLTSFHSIYMETPKKRQWKKYTKATKAFHFIPLVFSYIHYLINFVWSYKLYMSGCKQKKQHKHKHKLISTVFVFLCLFLPFCLFAFFLPFCFFAFCCFLKKNPMLYFVFDKSGWKI